MSSMIGRRYLDPGDSRAGYHNPPREVVVLVRWGQGGGPHNVLVELPNGSREVIPFHRRLRLPKEK